MERAGRSVGSAIGQNLQMICVVEVIKRNEQLLCRRYLEGLRR
jgi:hypothetical protein